MKDQTSDPEVLPRMWGMDKTIHQIFPSWTVSCNLLDIQRVHLLIQKWRIYLQKRFFVISTHGQGEFISLIFVEKKIDGGYFKSEKAEYNPGI